MSFEGAFARLGVGVIATRAIRTAASRPRGLLLFSGGAGAGKTTLAHHVVAAQLQKRVHWLDDIRSVDKMEHALTLAAEVPVVGVVRSGRSHGVRARWGRNALLWEAASVVTATVHRLPRTPASGLDVLVVEVLGPEGTYLTKSLVDEAQLVVDAGVTSADHIRGLTSEG